MPTVPLHRRIGRGALRALGVLVCTLWAAHGAQAQAVSVAFEVDLRAEIAAGRFDASRDAVGLRGATAPLLWSHSLLLSPRGDGRYAATVRFDTPPFGQQPVAHKFRIERPGQPDDAGWEPGRNHAAALDGPSPQVLRAFGAPALPLAPRITGQVLTLAPQAARHAQPRPVWVWLPPGYAQQAPRRYPVLYLADGQNVFDGSEAGAEWQVDETAQRLVLAGQIAPLIIVAVPSGRDRLREYTPTAGLLGGERRGEPGAAPQRVGGGAPGFARYLIEELKPQIDARFRTRPEAAHTAVGGSSLGGLLALWLALDHADTFGAALVVSPSVWWDDAWAVRAVSAARWPGAARPRLWLDIGGQEGPGAVPAVRQLRDALQQQGWGPATLAYTEAPDGGHDEASWAARVDGMLRFLQGPAPVAGTK